MYERSLGPAERAPVAERNGRLLIVNADDFGIAESTNRAIATCHDAGVVSSATLMVNMPAASHAVALAGARPHLGLGLHVNLTLGTPVSDPSSVSSLVDADGRFYERSVFERRAVLGKFRGVEIEAEIRAQFRRCAELGVQPSHFDSHQHVHTLPGVMRPFLNVVRACRAPVRVPWVSVALTKSPRRVARSWVLETLNRRLARTASRIDVSYNAAFGSIFDVAQRAEDISLQRYSSLLSAFSGKPSPVELMVHPAERGSNDASGLTRISEISHAETACLLDPRFRALIGAHGFSLATFKALRSS